MSEVLNASARSLIAERGHVALNRVLDAVEKNSSGISYLDAYRRFENAAMELGGGASVASVLQAAGLHDLDAVAQDLTTLERADAAKQKIHDTVARLHQLDAGSSGAASATAGQPPKLDAATYAKVMGAEPVAWERLHEARRLPGGVEFEGPGGQERFVQLDRQHADAGLDFVAGRRQAREVGAARREITDATRRLDAAIEKGKTPAERRRLLDSAATEGLRQLDAMSPPSTAPTSRAAIPERLKQLDSESPVEYTRRLQALIDSGELA